VVLGGASEILDLGRTRRLASPALRQAVGLRDGHCAFPGCEVALHRCELHHIKPWQDAGPTSLDNLVALCVRHHHLCEPASPGVDIDGYARPPDQWRIRMGPAGIPEFIAPEAYPAQPTAGPPLGTGSTGRASGHPDQPGLYVLRLINDARPLSHAGGVDQSSPS
jgi:hypothetical protein